MDQSPTSLEGSAMIQPDVPKRSRGRIGRIGRALGLRLATFGLMGLLTLLLVSEVSDILPFGTVAAPDNARPVEATPEEPGWPQRRGPTYDGISSETGIADSWPDDGPPLLWMRELGRGYSGFTAVGDRVYTQTQSLSKQMALCLDSDTGEQIWSHRYGWPYDPAGMYPGPRSTPTWHDGRIYFAGPRGLVGCLDAASGRALWSLNINEKFGGRGTDFGYSCSPTIEGGKVILPVGGKEASVVALDVDDGSTVWTSGDRPASYCSAIPIEVGGRRYVVSFLRNSLAIMDLETGHLAWQEKYSQGYDEHAAAPLFEWPYLIVASPFRSGAECYRLELVQRDPPRLEVTEAWFSAKLSNDTASSVLFEGHIYGFDLRDVQAKAHRPSRGEFRCLELTSGKVLWSTDKPGHASLIVADGKLIIFNDRGEVILARASPEKYTELARAQVFSGEICWTAPALVQGRLYLRSPSRGVCLYIGRPENLDRQQLAAAQPVSEVAGSSPFDLTRLVGGEREYAFDPADFAELCLWYQYSLLGVLGVAAAFATLLSLIMRLKWPDESGFRCRAVFWCSAFVMGVVGTPIFNRLSDQFIFTWPAALCVAHQITLCVVVWSGRRRENGQSSRMVVPTLLFFLTACLIYFLVCRRLSLAVEWLFLLGFLPSWLVALPAAYRLHRPGPLWRDFLWAALSLTAYFWAAGGIILWRTAMH